MNTEEIHSIKDYLVNPIVLKLNKEELELRNKIMHEIIKTKKAYIPENTQEENLLKNMQQKNTVVLNNNMVTCIYPVSVNKTNKKVFFENGEYSYAMCAIDAIGYHYTFNQKIRIESECEKCKEKLVLSVEDGKINVISGSQEIYILHADLQNSSNWSCSCCNIMHFFNCKNNLKQWLKENNISSRIFAIDLETANKIAWLLFSK